MWRPQRDSNLGFSKNSPSGATQPSCPARRIVPAVNAPIPRSQKRGASGSSSRTALAQGESSHGLGTFAFFLEDGYLLRFLSFLDLFGLWGWALVGLGVAKIGRKDSWAPAAAIVLLIPVGIAALIAIFNG